jgi:hypothetical protein
VIFISSSTPLTSGDHAGLVVKVNVKRAIEPPTDDSCSGDSSLQAHTSTTPSVCDSPGTTGPEELKVSGFFTLCSPMIGLYNAGAPCI